MSQGEDMNPRRILVADSELWELQETLERLEAYPVQLLFADNARDVLGYFESEQVRPDVLILETIMPYGDEAHERKLAYKGRADRQDAGINLLRYLSEKGRRSGEAHSFFTAMTTERCGVRFIRAARELLGNQGKIYFKPYDSFGLETDVVSALGLESKVSPMFRRDRVAPPCLWRFKRDRHSREV